MSLGVLDANIYPIVVAVSVITTFTTPYFIRLADPAYTLVERHLPARLHFLIERYSGQASAESETRALWTSVLKRYVWRIVLYSIVIIAIILVCTRFMLPWLLDVFPSWGRSLCSAMALLLMSPFLLALAIPASKRSGARTSSRRECPFRRSADCNDCFPPSSRSWVYSLHAECHSFNEGRMGSRIFHLCHIARHMVGTAP